MTPNTISTNIKKTVFCRIEMQRQQKKMLETHVTYTSELSVIRVRVIESSKLYSMIVIDAAVATGTAC